MAQPFKLPDLGEGIHEGEIVSVLVSVGDRVEEGRPILEIETDKATVEIPSPFTGTVLEILAKPGDTVKVGSVLMVCGGSDPTPVAAAPIPSLQDTRSAPDRRDPERVDAPNVAARFVGARDPEQAGGAGAKPEATAPPPATKGAAGPVPASPATRRLAREMGVDLRQVPPSGPAGLVTAQDVRAYARARERAPEEIVAPANGHEPSAEVAAEPGARAPRPRAAVETPAPPEGAPPLPDFSRWGPIEKVAVRSVRRATARRMALSWSQIPHVNHQDVVDITRLDGYRRQQAAEIEAAGGKLTLTVFVLKAVVAALKAFPRFNASLDPEAEEIILKRYYHLGVATDTDRGLLVPVLRDVDRKSIAELSLELSEMAKRARSGDTALEEMQGGTFTITNIGALGGTGFAPIINHPQVAILGMGRAQLQPVVLGSMEEYQIVPRLMMPLVLAFDHRVLDGADAARFVRMIVESLENPDRLWLRI